MRQLFSFPTGHSAVDAVLIAWSMSWGLWTYSLSLLIRTLYAPEIKPTASKCLVCHAFDRLIESTFAGSMNGSQVPVQYQNQDLYLFGIHIHVVCIHVQLELIINKWKCILFVLWTPWTVPLRPYEQEHPKCNLSCGNQCQQPTLWFDLLF